MRTLNELNIHVNPQLKPLSTLLGNTRILGSATGKALSDRQYHRIKNWYATNQRTRSMNWFGDAIFWSIYK